MQWYDPNKLIFKNAFGTNAFINIIIFDTCQMVLLCISVESVIPQPFKPSHYFVDKAVFMLQKSIRRNE